MSAADAELVDLATRTYVYGYPLVYNLREIAKLPEGTSSFRMPVPFDRFAPGRALAGPETKFVSPNNDTLYLLAACDVSGGPLLIGVPDTRTRYYVLQFVDAWTNNFAYVGTRATGNRAGSFVLTSPGFDGAVPADAIRIDAPTSVAVIVGRLAVDGEWDLREVHALQDRFTMEPLEQGGNGADLLSGIPQPRGGIADELLWWERFRVALAAFPPPAGDAPFVEAAGRLGLTALESPFISPDPALAAALVAGAAQGAAFIETLGRRS